MDDVDKAPVIDQHVLGLRNQFSFRERAVTMGRIGRQEVSDLARRGRRADVVDERQRDCFGSIWNGPSADLASAGSM